MKAKLTGKEVEEKKAKLIDEYVRLLEKFRLSDKRDGEKVISISRKISIVEAKIELLNELF